MTTVISRAAQIELICQHVTEQYVFPDVAIEVTAVLRRRRDDGGYEAAADEEFAAAVTADLQSVNGDKHLQLRHSVEPVPEPDSGPDNDLMEREVDRNAGGIRRVERLAGNVGYLDLIAFFPAAVAGWAAAAAMNLLAGTDALIVDLRRSRGGDPGMVALLCSYLVDEPLHLNDLHARRDGTTTQFWTLPYVPGPRFGGRKPVYVLTSADTFSAAEEFAYNMQQHGRGTIIGARTRGGAHPCDRFQIAEHLIATVPVARAINPVSGTNWEGVGIAPDVETPADAAFQAGYERALRHVVGLGADGRRDVHTEAVQALRDV
jgi:Peptidase family S41/N-terminal domain of Peptidase_S41 in eukaryotic IRBP